MSHDSISLNHVNPSEAYAVVGEQPNIAANQERHLNTPEAAILIGTLLALTAVVVSVTEKGNFPWSQKWRDHYTEPTQPEKHFDQHDQNSVQ